MTDHSPKKRGAPRGNRNALKHGLYSAAYRADERRRLSSIPSDDSLHEEINVIRIAMYRFLKALRASSDSLDVTTQLAALRAINLSARSITSLLRAQSFASSTSAARRRNAETLANLESLAARHMDDEAAPPPPPDPPAPFVPLLNRDIIHRPPGSE